MTKKKNDNKNAEAELLKKMQEDIRNRKSALLKIWNTYKVNNNK